MARSTAEIARDIAQFTPVDENWGDLDKLLDELWTTGEPAMAIPAMLSVFERFPGEELGDGVLWSIVHGLESLPGYELHLLRSVLRVPSALGVLMLGRRLNSNLPRVDGVSIRMTLRAIANDAAVPKEVRETAERFLLCKRVRLALDR